MTLLEITVTVQEGVKTLLETAIVTVQKGVMTRHYPGGGYDSVGDPQVAAIVSSS